MVIVAFLAGANGAEANLLAYLVGRYFGRRSFGALYGLLLGASSMGYGAPLVAGWVFDRTGSYALIYGPLAASAVLAAEASPNIFTYPPKGSIAIFQRVPDLSFHPMSSFPNPRENAVIFTPHHLATM